MTRARPSTERATAARVPREALLVAGEAQRQAAARLDERHRLAGQRRGRVDGVARLARGAAEVAAPDEERVVGVGAHAARGTECGELAGGNPRVDVVPREAVEDAAGPGGRDAGAGERVARVEQHAGDGVLVVAHLAARVAAGARPRGGGAVAVDGHVAVRRHPGEAHLAPRRHRLPRLGVGDGARAPAQLRAEDALLERAPVRLQQRERPHRTEAGARHGGPTLPRRAVRSRTKR